MARMATPLVTSLSHVPFPTTCGTSLALPNRRSSGGVRVLCGLSLRLSCAVPKMLLSLGGQYVKTDASLIVVVKRARQKRPQLDNPYFDLLMTPPGRTNMHDLKPEPPVASRRGPLGPRFWISPHQTVQRWPISAQARQRSGICDTSTCRSLIGCGRVLDKVARLMRGSERRGSDGVALGGPPRWLASDRPYLRYLPGSSRGLLRKGSSRWGSTRTLDHGRFGRLRASSPIRSSPTSPRSLRRAVLGVCGASLPAARQCPIGGGG